MKEVQVRMQDGGHLETSKALQLEGLKAVSSAGLKQTLKLVPEKPSDVLNAMIYPDLGPGSCDYCEREKWANVLTSFPFVLAGAHLLRHSNDKRSKTFAGSVFGTAAASTIFHSFRNDTHPKHKTVFRRIDYCSVATSMVLLLHAARAEVPNGFYTMAAVMTPINPLAVSTVCTGAIQQTYRKRANGTPALRNRHRLHQMVAFAGMAAFVTEEFKKDIPCSHAAWHCFAAMATATTAPLLPGKEELAELS